MLWILISVLFLPYLRSAPVEPFESYLELLSGDHDQQVLGAKFYLLDYGYVSVTEIDEAVGTLEDKIGKGIMVFQEMENIPSTGKVDDETKLMMEYPRCQNPDVVAKRSKRSSEYRYKWDKKEVTYSFINFPRLRGIDLRRTMRDAFDLWSDDTSLTFKEVLSGGNIKIEFRYIDGPSQVVGRGYYPKDGYILFDSAEAWTLGVATGKNLLQVATHEIGHAIGLNHTTVKNAVMHPFYQGYKENLSLTQDDIQAARKIYG